MFGVRFAWPALLLLAGIAVVGDGEANDKPKKPDVPELFANRIGEKREAALREYGGTTESETAVAEGLKWLVRNQLSDGRWALTAVLGAARSDSDPVAGTAFGLLPFLAAGKTHKPAAKNPYDKNVDKGLKFLMNAQDAKTGFFGGTMYSHGLATLALCEAYGLTQDPVLRRYAQGGINLIVLAQSGDKTGWSYKPDKGEGHRDLSISGWQIQALKAGQAAGLIVPKAALDRSVKFLDDSVNFDEGYGYLPGSPSTTRMSAVGLLCRQHLQDWGPANPKMISGVKKYLKPNRPDIADVYYYYYATQVMFHLGGDDWKDWNEKMREFLIKKQDVTKGANRGSWSPEGDTWGHLGGRLMITSLNLLTLEVYYRHKPLFEKPGKNKDEAK